MAMMSFPFRFTAGQMPYYLKQVEESEGFDVDYVPCDFGNIIRPIQPFSPSSIEMHKLKPLTDKAVELYNSENPTDKIKNPRLVKANFLLAGPFTYYITFKARDSSGNKRIYQTKIDRFVPLDQSIVRFVRLKPKKEKRAKNTKPGPVNEASDVVEGELDGDDKAEKAMKKQKRKRIIRAEGQENLSSCFCAASSSAEEAVEPSNDAEMEEQGESTAGHN